MQPMQYGAGQYAGILQGQNMSTHPYMPFGVSLGVGPEQMHARQAALAGAPVSRTPYATSEQEDPAPPHTLTHRS